MTNPRVTALIDTYNHGRYLEEAIESVLAQDFPANEMEILVVDDGSTDDTPQRVARFGSRVRYVRKENGGQASALNLGFEHARGEIVAMLDGDDLWLPNKLRRVMEEFEEHPEAGMVYHPYRWWNMEAGLQVDDPDFPGVSGFVPDSPAGLLRYGDVGTCGMAFRRNIVEKLLPIPTELKIYADAHLAYLAIFVAPVVAIPEPLTRYRIHGQNRHARTDSGEQAVGRLQYARTVVREMKQWLADHGYELQEGALAAYLKRYELATEEMRFAVQEPGRYELYSHLREKRQLYAPAWTRRYRFFRVILDGVAGLLGYKRYCALQEFYRRATFIRLLRETLFPARSPAS